MKVFYHLNQIAGIDRGTVVTIGSFDGVHLGHKKVLKTLTETAHQKQSRSVVVTFWPHPKKVLFPEEVPYKVLFSLDERVELFAEYNIDYLVVIPFDKSFSLLSPQGFIQDIIVDKVKAHTLILGYDHRFGNQREGSFEYLNKNAVKFGLSLIEIPRQDIDDIAISSTRIREAILKSDFDTAKELLGHHYYFKGEVIKGMQLGNTIGFPTANIKINEPDKLIPQNGVYAAMAEIDNKKIFAMMNIGHKPTLGQYKQSIEVNLFDFDANIYGATIKVFPIAKMREEQKFDSIETLKQQLSTDRVNAIKILKTLA